MQTKIDHIVKFQIKVDAKLMKRILENAESPEFSGKCIVKLAEGTCICNHEVFS